ncbi:MAG TPA: MBL fold metallo-hydrolase [Limnochordales bacterium]
MSGLALRVLTVAVGMLQANSYVLLDDEGGAAAVIDPGDEPERILQALQGYRVQWIVATHGHFDHVGAVRAVKEATGAPFLVHPGDLELLHYAADAAQLFTGRPVPVPPDPDESLRHGQVLQVGPATLEVRHTPGHSPGSVSLVLRTPVSGSLEGSVRGVFTGDALFAGSIGRTDMPGGDHDTLVASIRRWLLVLPDACPVWPGHGPATTIGQERRTNPFLTGLG